MHRAIAVCLLAVVAASPLGCTRAHEQDGDALLLDDGRTFASDADADTFTGPAPLTVRFTGVTANAFGRATYSWTFDDRTTSAEQNPTHTFGKQGWYRVFMDARDDAGHTDRTALLLHVWRPRDWARMQSHRDMRIVMRSLRELKRKNAQNESAASPEPAEPPKS